MELFGLNGIWIGIAAAALSGCVSLSGNSNIKDDFDCKAVEGEGCVSIGEMRHKIASSGAHMTPIYKGGAPAVSVSGVPQWRSDEILKIHIGDFVDSSGIYHDDSVIYVVASQGGWEVQ